MKHLRLALISLLVLPLFSCSASSLSAFAADRNKQFTATGKKDSSIAFIAVRQQDDTVKAGLFTVDRDGSHRRNLTPKLTIIPSENTITGVVWSPDKQRLAFVQLGVKGTYTVYAVNADGSGLTKLFSDNQCSPASAQFNGVWSSDGQNLVFERTCPTYDGQAGYRSRTELYVSDTTRGQHTRLIRRWIQSGANSIETSQQTGLTRRSARSGITSNLAISPNAKQVVFFEDQILYRMNTDGTQLTRLPILPAPNLSQSTTFVWSPDSARIARLDQYLEKPDEQTLYLLDTSGKLLNQTSKRGTLDPVQLQWSPDSTRLAYYQVESENVPVTEGNIYSLDIAGGTPKNLTQRRDRYVIFSWSPDGQQIAAKIKQSAKLYLVNADGSGSKDVTLPFSNLVEPMWSSNGQQIAFVVPELTSSSPTIHLYVMNRDGSELKRLTDDRDLGVTHFAWQP